MPDNNRVTLAVLSTKLDIVIAKLDELAQLQAADHDRIGVLEGELKRTNDRISIWQAGQAALSVVLASVAAWLGGRR